jgi:hypothetical protein
MTSAIERTLQHLSDAQQIVQDIEAKLDADKTAIFALLIRAVEELQRLEIRVDNLEGSRNWCLEKLGEVLPMPKGGPNTLEFHISQAITYIRRLESRNWTCVKCSQVNAHWATKCGRCDTEAP